MKEVPLSLQKLHRLRDSRKQSTGAWNGQHGPYHTGHSGHFLMSYALTMYLTIMLSYTNISS